MLAYETIGSGEPLVLVHGIGHRRQAWYPVVERLSEHRQVLLFDLPGHGQSAALDTGGRPVKDVLQDHLVAFLDALGLERPHIAGYSLGGRIALEAGADGLARSVTGLAPAGFWRSRADFAYIRGLFATMTTLAHYTRPIAPHLTRTRAGRAVMYAWLLRHPTLLDPEVALGDFHALLAARPALRTIIAGGYPFDRTLPADVPVTIAWGTHDRVLRPHQAKRARRILPSATHITLPHCGHVPMSDNPALVADVLLRGSALPAAAAPVTPAEPELRAS